MEDTNFSRLKQFLASLPAGSLTPKLQEELVRLLKNCWDAFAGSYEEKMAEYKLERMKSPLWKPPVLNFEIIKHGSTFLGSSRAERQAWYSDLDRKIAESQIVGYRQIHQREPGFNVKPTADELADLIMRGMQDERLQWSTDGRVRILSGKIIPSGTLSPKQTVEGRRKRLIKALEERLTPRGWRRHGSWWEKTI